MLWLKEKSCLKIFYSYLGWTAAVQTQFQVVSLIEPAPLTEGVGTCDMSCWNVFWNEACVNQVWDTRSKMLNTKQCLALSLVSLDFPVFSYAVTPPLAAYSLSLKRRTVAGAAKRMHSSSHRSPIYQLSLCVAWRALSCNFLSWILIYQWPSIKSTMIQ